MATFPCFIEGLPMNADYQAIYEAASDLYAAMQALERRLAAQSPDANVQREAMRLTTTRLAIQKLLGTFISAPPPPLPPIPSTPGATLSAKPLKGKP
jgi:hypothetical protein